jgi:hypothetical protein
MRAKPRNPGRPTGHGLPVAWFLMGMPRPTFPGGAGDVADLMGTHQAGVRNGGCTLVRGPLGGKCLSLDGTSGYVTLPTAVVLPGDFTLAFRINWTSVSSTGWGLILGSPGSATTDDGLFIKSSKIDYDSGGTVHLSAATLTPGTWYDCAVTRGGDVVAFYVDGIPAGTATPASVKTLTVNQIGNDTLEFLGGSIDNIRVDSRAWSAAEVAREHADPWRRLRPRRRLARLAAAISSPAAGPRGRVLGGSRVIQSTGSFLA